MLNFLPPLLFLRLVQTYYEWNGMRCAYRQQGDKGKPVVLIHGFGVSSFQYRDTLKALSLTNKVYALDLVGFGSSGTTRGSLSVSLCLSL
jgi:pimeloyl-ACP methyl ester carboxylesterase